MKTLLSSLLLFFSVTLHAQQDTLMWADEFNGSGVPDPANWSYDLGAGGWGNNEIQTYTNLTQNVRQDSGKLIIEARKLGYNWTSARILSRNKFSFTYGRIVFSAKLPKGSGTWPALWMLGQNLSTAGWPACGEVDVMEHVGKAPNVVHSSLHTPSSYGNTVNTKTINVANVFSQFHEYQAYWTPEKIEFSVDGNLFYTYNPANKTNATWPFKNPFFIIMNIAMGGNFGSDPAYETGGLKNGVDPSLSLARMEVDYVRVYKFSYPAGIGEGNLVPAPNHMIISPNPTSGKITLSMASGQPAKGVIYNLTGSDVFHFQTSNNTTDIDISSLSKGLYFLSVTSDKETNVEKIVLN